MERSDEAMVAYALELPSALLPHATELLADLDALGADIPLILTAISGLGLPPSSVVLDLGSGKGAVSIAIARSLDLTVHGIELFAPFVDIARRAADAAGVAGRCRFSHGEIGRMAGAVAPADVAVFAALGDVLGPLDVTVGIIRRYVRPGGYLVINDCYRREGSTATLPGFDQLAGAAETRRLLCAHGDTLVAELIEEADDVGDAADAVDEGALLAARAAALAERRPELAGALHGYVAAQLAEYDFLDRHTVGAVWVLQRR